MFSRLLLSLILTSTFSLVSDVCLSQEIENSHYLENRLGEFDKRYQSFVMIMDILQERNAKLLVETGTSRDGASNFAGDGGSTIIFADWATDNDAYLYTVDIDPRAIANSQQAAAAYAHNVDFVVSDSIKYLSEFAYPIDFLYLDSYDFNLWDPTPSQTHHLREIEAAYDKLHENSVVMIDDCDLPYGGKGKLVIDYLRKRNWKIIYSGYQVILVRKKSIH